MALAHPPYNRQESAAISNPAKLSLVRSQRQIASDATADNAMTEKHARRLNRFYVR
jgi:hypothetical protein